MPKYNVWIYPIGKFLVRDVEADSQEQACKIAWDRVEEIDIEHAVARLGHRHVVEITSADDIYGYLVDEQDNPGHDKSQWYDEHRKLRGPEPPMVVITVSGGVSEISQYGDVDLVKIDWDNFDGAIFQDDLADIEEQMELINTIPDPEVRGAILESYNELKQDFEESEEIVP